ncbi:hypothetical protein SAMN05443246_3572 [Paenibacillus sp. GP183]|nr:hypothetical protein SAMN05443246_3572 [Paenibacillus sp. GP183]
MFFFSVEAFFLAVLNQLVAPMACAESASMNFMAVYQLLKQRPTSVPTRVAFSLHQDADRYYDYSGV